MAKRAVSTWCILHWAEESMTFSWKARTTTSQSWFHVNRKGTNAKLWPSSTEQPGTLRSRCQDKHHTACLCHREHHKSRAVQGPNHRPLNYRFPISPLNGASEVQALAFSPAPSMVFSFLPFFPYISVNVTVTPTTIALYSFFLVLLFYKNKPQKRCSHAVCSALPRQVQAIVTATPPIPTPRPAMPPAHPPDLLWIFLFALCSPKILSASLSTKTDWLRMEVWRMYVKQADSYRLQSRECSS